MKATDTKATPQAIQETPKLLSGPATNEAHNNSVHAITEDEGGEWHLVRSKRSQKKIKALDKIHHCKYNRQGNTQVRQHRGNRGFANPKIEEAYARAFNARLCLRCMGKGHTRAHCRGPMKCFICHKFGHGARFCKDEALERDKPTTQIQQNSKPPKKKVQFSKQIFAQVLLNKTSQPDMAQSRAMRPISNVRRTGGTVKAKGATMEWRPEQKKMVQKWVPKNVQQKITTTKAKVATMVWRPKQKKMVQKWVPKNVRQKLITATPPATQQATKNHIMAAKRIISLSDTTRKRCSWYQRQLGLKVLISLENNKTMLMVLEPNFQRLNIMILQTPTLLILGGQLMSQARKLTLPPTMQLQEEKIQNTKNELYEEMTVQSVLVPQNEILNEDNMPSSPFMSGPSKEKTLSPLIETKSLEGPPPGFPGPPKFAKQSLRRSARLSTKSGPYISFEQRAAIQSKKSTSSALAKTRKKPIKHVSIQMEYLKSYDPINIHQAEIIVAAAGVELPEYVAKQVETTMIT
jgi:hypothetical protein